MSLQKFNQIPLIILLILVFLGIPDFGDAQQYKWMAAGSLHNWFSEMGCEIEEGRSAAARQQDGLMWPAHLPYQDNQAAKGFWIGCRNFTDERGDLYEYKVVTVGPRSKGFGEFFPTEFKMVSRFEVPKVFVDEAITFEKNVIVEEVDPAIPATMMIVNKANTLLGLSMERNIMQFSIPRHDNYIVQEFIFTNTGNVDDDDEIELQNNTLTDVWFFYQYRLAPTQQTRYIIGNGTGWGMNTMIDARGDGPDNPVTYNDSPEETEYNGKQIRAQFVWHGYFPDKVVDYDNIGGPIWRPFAPYVATYDTVGRLGAPQFVGIITLHADKSSTDNTDDPAQPATTGWYGSDLPETGPNSDPYNVKEMQERYTWMEMGHFTPRHAWAVVPDGDFAAQTKGANLSLGGAKNGGPGGFSIGNGYGPYTIGQDESIRIVIAEAVNGMDTRNCINYGKQYKSGALKAYNKNTLILSGKDSLFQTFRNAIDNFQSGYQVPRPPKPPRIFSVTGGGDRISLDWEVYDTENLAGFEIYRLRGEYDNPLLEPVLIYTAGPGERNYDDFTAVRGIGYYYYIIAVGSNGLNSNRTFTQSFDPAFLKRPQGSRLDDIRVVPNPYIISSTESRLRFPGGREADKLAFFNIPGQCRIRIFTETGELVKTIEHTDGSGDAYWYALTEYNQVIVSGVYIAHIEVTQDINDTQTGEVL
ncbi:MAG: hypothetical protein EH225_06380, partial [Calditrichaeota bacterium]